jgi:hypothetical protein
MRISQDMQSLGTSDYWGSQNQTEHDEDDCGSAPFTSDFG